MSQPQLNPFAWLHQHQQQSQQQQQQLQRLQFKQQKPSGLFVHTADDRRSMSSASNASSARRMSSASSCSSSSSCSSHSSLSRASVAPQLIVHAAAATARTPATLHPFHAPPPTATAERPHSANAINSLNSSANSNSSAGLAAAARRPTVTSPLAAPPRQPFASAPLPSPTARHPPPLPHPRPPSQQSGMQNHPQIQHQMQQNLQLLADPLEAVAPVRDYFRHLLNIPKRAALTSQSFADFLVSDIIQTAAIDTPYGTRPLVMADFCSVGRPLKCVETAILTHVLPHYGAVQSGTYGTGLSFLCKRIISFSTTIVKASFGADLDEYACLFTDIVPKKFIEQLIRLIDVAPLQSLAPRKIVESQPSQSSHTNSQAPVIIVSASEDPENTTAWTAAGAIVASVGTGPSGTINLRELHDKLRAFKDSRLIIAFFPAVCQASGVIHPVADITRVVHKHNRLVFFDFTIAAPFVDVRLSATADKSIWPDGIIASTSNLLGGPSARSVVLIRKSLKLPVASTSASGNTTTTQNDTPVQRDFPLTSFETGSKTDVIGIVRAGLACLIKSTLIPRNIQWRQLELTSAYFDRLKHPNIVVLGMELPNRLPTIAFVIKGPESKKILHHRFIRRLLNDMFGIQAWSGSTASGDHQFNMMKLGISQHDKTIHPFVKLDRRPSLAASPSTDPITVSTNVPYDLITPGYTRIDLSFMHTMEEITYILDAVLWIATNGYTVLPMYQPIRGGADWSVSSKLPIDNPEMPQKPHTRTRRMDIKTYVQDVDEALKQFWQFIQFQEVAGMTRNQAADAYYHGKPSVPYSDEFASSVASIQRDGRATTTTTSTPDTTNKNTSSSLPDNQMEPWYLTKEDVHDYLVRAGRLRVGFAHVPMSQRPKWPILNLGRGNSTFF